MPKVANRPMVAVRQAHCRAAAAEESALPQVQQEEPQVAPACPPELGQGSQQDMWQEPEEEPEQAALPLVRPPEPPEARPSDIPEARRQAPAAQPPAQKTTAYSDGRPHSHRLESA